MNEMAWLVDPLRVLAFAAARIGGAFIIFPMLEEKVVSGMARNCIIVSMGLIILPVVHAQMPEKISMMMTVMLMGKEVFLGVLMGFGAALVFWVFDAVGAIIDQQTGSTLSGVMDPLQGHPEGPTGGFLVQLVSVFLMTSGGFLLFLGAIYESYSVWPVFTFWPTMDARLEYLSIAQWHRMMELIIKISAPILVVFLFVEFSLGLMQRYATTLNVFFLSQPIKQLLASVLLGVLLVMLGTELFSGFDVTTAVRSMMGVK
jgi:type III secretion protein T